MSHCIVARRRTEQTTTTGPYLLDDSVPAAEWDGFVRSVPGSHHTQTMAWAAVRSQLGAEFLRVTVRRRGSIVAGLQAFTLDIPFVGKSLVGVGGPEFADDAASSRIAFIESLIDWSWTHGMKGIVVQPHRIDRVLERALDSHGFRRSPVSPQLPATAVVDLRQSDEAISAAMAPKARYNIRRGLRGGIQVTEAGPEGPRILSELLAATAKRQGFTRPTSEKELRLLLQTMQHDPVARIFLARIGDQVLSGALIIGFGDTALYKRGAWSGERSDLHPNEVMHGHIIDWARAAGYARYDLDGMNASVAARMISGEPASPSGVTRFKLKLGAEPRLRPEASVLFRHRHLGALAGFSTKLPERLLERVVDGLRQRL